MDAVRAARFVLSLQDIVIGFKPVKSPPLVRTETPEGFPVFTVGGLSLTVEYFHEEHMNGVLVLRSDTNLADETIKLPRSGRIEEDLRTQIYYFFLAHFLVKSVAI